MSLNKLYVATQLALSNKKGAAMVEYALLAALIAAALVASLTGLAGGISTKFASIVTSL